jgi:hypothetical protein
VAFDVTNGRIPDVVERFLREVASVYVVPPTPYRRRWAVHAPHDTPRESYNEFDWPHDRTPTLQEAIEALMHQRGTQ